MHFEMMRDPASGSDDVLRFSGELTMHEVEALDLDPLDKALVDDINHGPASPHDYLLVLEMLFRRHAEKSLVGAASE